MEPSDAGPGLADLRYSAAMRGDFIDRVLLRILTLTCWALAAFMAYGLVLALVYGIIDLIS